jgi:hypothetical protein
VRRFVDPISNLFLHERADAAQLGQWPVLRDEVRYFLRPEKRAPRCSTISARKNSSLAFRLLSKQLRNIRV